MNAIVAFILVCVAWLACCVCYAQFMTWYDHWRRQRDLRQDAALRETCPELYEDIE